MKEDKKGYIRTEIPCDGYDAEGKYKEEAKEFLRQCLDKETFEIVMRDEKSHRCSYVAARLFLSREDWDRYVWIEQYGSLEGYRDQNSEEAV